MLKHWLCLFLSCSTLLLYGYDVKWSSVIDDRDNNYLKIIGEDENGFYVLNSNISFEDERDKVGFKGRHYHISFFTDDMVLKWTHALEAPLEDGKIVSINMADDKVLVTFSLADRKQNLYRIFAQYLNGSGAYADSAKPVFETAYSRMNDKEKPATYISKNNSLIACVCKVPPADKKEEQDYHVVIMDTTLSVLYKKDFTVPYEEKEFTPQNVILNNDGGFYLLGIRTMNDRKAKAPGESYYIMYYCNHASDEVHTEEINPAKEGASIFLTDASLTYDNINHKIVVAGFFSEISSYSSAGTFYYGLRTDTVQKADVRMTSFNQDFLAKFHGEIKEHKNKELIDYSINHIILRRDGGAVIIAEAVTSTYSSYYDYFSQMYISHRYYVYGNIISLSVNPDGSMLWSDVLSKDQESRDDGGYYSSYCNITDGDKMFFIYNKYIGDHPSVLLSSVNSKGDQRTDVLFNEEDHVVTIPSGGKQISEDEIVMPAMKEGKLRFVKITF